MVELKNIRSKLQIFWLRLSRKMEMTNLSEVEYRSIEIIQFEKERKKTEKI